MRHQSKSKINHFTTLINTPIKPKKKFFYETKSGFLGMLQQGMIVKLSMPNKLNCLFKTQKNCLKNLQYSINNKQIKHEAKIQPIRQALAAVEKQEYNQL